MNATSLTWLAALLLAACGPTAHPAPAAPPPAPSSSAANLPIAQYLGDDHATGTRVFELLRAAGIESSAGGSLGYSVWVSGAARVEARRLLLSAITRECLPITVFDDRGAALAHTRPSRCP